MRENGIRTREMGEVWSDIPTVTDTRVILLMVNPMVMVFILGLMERSTRVNGLRVSNKVKESGKVYLETLILDNGINLRRQGMVCTNGKMVIDMRGSGLAVLSMVRELISLLMVILLQESMFMVSLLVRASINGKMAVFTLENLEMG